jgi:hypothetical protein
MSLNVFSATSTPNRSGLHTIHRATASTLRISVSTAGDTFLVTAFAVPLGGTL